MSEYVKVELAFKNEGDLLIALLACGFEPEVHEEAIPLIDYRGQSQSDTKANIIVRRKQLSRYSNDLGFERMADGTLRPHVSDYDSPPRSNVFPRIKREYAVAANTRAARRRGWRVNREDAKDGSVKLTVSGIR